MKQVLILATLAASATAADCPNYEQYARVRHTPFSCGKYKLPYQRPAEDCRLFVVPEVEKTIKDMKKKIHDPDLYRLFVNNWPNTVDTTVLWRGHAADNADEELAFVVTGDINAMWLRDSANQLQSYKPILNSTVAAKGENDIASLYRGVINLHSRYVKKYPFCNSFQPPAESKIPPVNHRKRSLMRRDTVNPPYDPNEVWECKYELDTPSAFLQLSWDYYEATGDGAFFGKYHWKEAVKTVLDMADSMMTGTYTDDGVVNPSPYTWFRDSNSATETVSNNGNGNPIVGHIGLVRSFFRPSDDSTIYQYFIPANMMFARNLETCAKIMASIDSDLTKRMTEMAAGIRKGIDAHARVQHPKYGEIYAYEVDGFGSVNFMDDANVPSLLSIPHIGYEDNKSAIYKRTRDFALGKSNPYYCFGPVLNSTGGPHQGPGQAWPMAVIMQIMTSDDDDEIVHSIKQLLGSTSGLGLIHESVNSHDENHFTRSWFAWAAGLCGQMLLDLADRKPQLLSRSYQN